MCVLMEQEANKPEPDKLLGLRVHSWVLVLHGKREVASSFFIEASTGERRELNDERYYGIEAVFCHNNYWVNMQDCGNGLKVCFFSWKRLPSVLSVCIFTMGAVDEILPLLGFFY